MKNEDHVSFVVKKSHKIGIFVDNAALQSAFHSGHSAHGNKILDIVKMKNDLEKNCDLRYTNLYTRVIYDSQDYARNGGLIDLITSLRFKGILVHEQSFKEQESKMAGEEIKIPPRSLVPMTVDIMKAASHLDHFIIICDSGTLSPLLQHLRDMGKIVTLIYNQTEQRKFTAAKSRKLATKSIPIHSLLEFYGREKGNEENIEEFNEED